MQALGKSIFIQLSCKARNKQNFHPQRHLLVSGRKSFCLTQATQSWGRFNLPSFLLWFSPLLPHLPPYFSPSTFSSSIWMHFACVVRRLVERLQLRWRLALTI